MHQAVGQERHSWIEKEVNEFCNAANALRDPFPHDNCIKAYARHCLLKMPAAVPEASSDS